jgi:hypothetical protein
MNMLGPGIQLLRMQSERKAIFTFSSNSIQLLCNEILLSDY